MVPTSFPTKLLADPESPSPDPANPSCCRKAGGRVSTAQMGLDGEAASRRRAFPCSAVPLGLPWLFSTFSAFFRPSPRDSRCRQLRTRRASSPSRTPRRTTARSPRAPGSPAGSGPGGLRGLPRPPGLAPAIPSPPLSAERMLTPGTDLDVTRWESEPVSSVAPSDYVKRITHGHKRVHPHPPSLLSQVSFPWMRNKFWLMSLD